MLGITIKVRTIKIRQTYTAQTGLLYFDCAAVIAIGSWYYVLAWKFMRAKPCIRYSSVNIGPSYIK